MAQVQLAGGGSFLAAVRNAVDDQGTGAADSFAAIGVEGNRFLAAPDELLIHHVQHFEERHVREDVRRLVGQEAARVARVFLPPNVESQFHLRSTIYDLRAHEWSSRPEQLNRPECLVRGCAAAINPVALVCSTEYFPLTLTLSLREREQQASDWCLADGRWANSDACVLER